MKTLETGEKKGKKRRRKLGRHLSGVFSFTTLLGGRLRRRGVLFQRELHFIKCFRRQKNEKRKRERERERVRDGITVATKNSEEGPVFQVARNSSFFSRTKKKKKKEEEDEDGEKVTKKKEEKEEASNASGILRKNMADRWEKEGKLGLGTRNGSRQYVYFSHMTKMSSEHIKHENTT